jgi:hypothetical protein
VLDQLMGQLVQPSEGERRPDALGAGAWPQVGLAAALGPRRQTPA